MKGTRIRMGRTIVQWFAIAAVALIVSACRNLPSCPSGQVVTCNTMGANCLCTNRCTDVADCPVGQHCLRTTVGNVCEPSDLFTSSCSDGTDCSGGVCFSSGATGHRCAPLCERDSDCATGCCAGIRASSGDGFIAFACVEQAGSFYRCGGRAAGIGDAGVIARDAAADATGDR
jgi:hypothetical protein